MRFSVHSIDPVPGPQDTGWVDPILSIVDTQALVGRPVGLGSGILVAFGGDGSGFDAGPVTVAPGSPYEIVHHHGGPSSGPARYAQVTTFTGRTAEWCAAFDRSGEERIWPAVKDVPGQVATITGAAGPDGRIAITLAESVESLEAGAAAIMSTRLLPWEDPAHLTGPDSMAILKLLHADLPEGAVR